MSESAQMNVSDVVSRADVARSPATWLNARQAAKLLECEPRQVPKLAALGLIGVRELPGVKARFRRADVEALARDSVKPRTSNIIEG
jgi:hypothetical protein